MIQLHGNAFINTLGEASKPIKEYTLYHYLELRVNNQLIQLRDVYVHDQINAGLVAGISADVAIATVNEYTMFSLAEPVNECILLRSKDEERTNFSILIEQLDKRPSFLKLPLWVLLMPIRVFGSAARNTKLSGLGALIGVFGATYFSIFLAPIVAPFTFFKRRRIYKELTESTQAFLEETRSINRSSDEYYHLSASIKPI